MDWIMDQRRLELAKSDAIYMHPLPADRILKSPMRSSTDQFRGLR